MKKQDKVNISPKFRYSNICLPFFEPLTNIAVKWLSKYTNKDIGWIEVKISKNKHNENYVIHFNFEYVDDKYEDYYLICKKEKGEWIYE